MEYYARHLRPQWSKLGNRLMNIVLLVCLVLSVYHNKIVQVDRYSNPKYTSYLSINPAIYTLGPYLEEIGLDHDAVVVSIPDRSPNITLCAINRYGYTTFNTKIRYNNHDLYDFQKFGASYLIISDSTLLKKPFYQPFLKNKIGEYMGIYIYDIRTE